MFFNKEEKKEDAEKLLDDAPLSTKAVYLGTTYALYVGAVAVGLACVPPFSFPVAAAGLTLGLASIIGKAFILAEQEKRQVAAMFNGGSSPRKPDEGPQREKGTKPYDRIETRSKETKQTRTQKPAPSAAVMKHFRDMRSK